MKCKKLFASAILGVGSMLFLNGDQVFAEEENNYDLETEGLSDDRITSELSGNVSLDTENETETNNVLKDETVFNETDKIYLDEEVNQPKTNEDILESSNEQPKIPGWSEDGYKYGSEDNWLNGEVEVDGKWYYFDPNNDNKKVISSFVDLKDTDGNNIKKYYTEFGERKVGQAKIEGLYYFFDPKDGKMLTGEVLIPKEYNKAEGREKWVYYEEDGKMHYGQAKVNGVYKYFKPNNGERAVGEILIPKEYNKAEGRGKWVYYNEDGTMRYGQAKVNGVYKYFKPNNGERAVGEIFIPKEYNKAEGRGKWVYYEEDGKMHYGQAKVNGVYKYFKPNNGERAVGEILIPKEYNKAEGKEKWVLYNDKGEMLYGFQKVGNNEKYYSEQNGGLIKNQIIKLGSSKYFIDSNGNKFYGNEFKLNGRKYFCNPNTGVVTTVEEKIDSLCVNILNQVGWNLKSAFLWCVRNIKYQNLPIHVSTDGTTLTEEYALRGFSKNVGNCYCYAAPMYYLAKRLNYDAKMVYGYCLHRDGKYHYHGFITVKQNGIEYVVDPEARYELGGSGNQYFMEPKGATSLSYLYG